MRAHGKGVDNDVPLEHPRGASRRDVRQGQRPYGRTGGRDGHGVGRGRRLDAAAQPLREPVRVQDGRGENERQKNKKRENSAKKSRLVHHLALQSPMDTPNTRAPGPLES